MKFLSLVVSYLFAATLGTVTLAQTPPPQAAAATTTTATVDSSEESGLAAVYSNRLAGHRTASGKRYDPKQLTAAHKTLPFGTRVEVTNVKNGKKIELQITDRGPRQADRILDITPRAAHALGIRSTAMGEVKLKVLGN